MSSTPGRTRAVNYFLINGRIYFVDLPGYGYAKVGKQTRRGWAELVDEYLRNARSRTQVIQLVDSKVGATDLDIQAFRYFRELAVPVTVAATKIDRVPRGRRDAVLAAIRERLGAGRDVEIVPFSARSGEGVRELWQAVEPHLPRGGAPAPGAQGRGIPDPRGSS